MNSRRWGVVREGRDRGGCYVTAMRLQRGSTKRVCWGGWKGGGIPLCGPRCKSKAGFAANEGKTGSGGGCLGDLAGPVGWRGETKGPKSVFAVWPLFSVVQRESVAS